MTPRVLILDDERRMVDILAMVLRREGHDARGCTEPAEALEALETDAIDLLLTDLRMPGMDGLEVLRRARALTPDLPVVLMTAHATVSTAIAAMREGAFDYIQKPFENDELKLVVARALEVTRLGRENRYLRAELRSRHAPFGIVAESAAMRTLLERVQRVARSTSTVLITGESGTGKELIARALHGHSDRVDRPFVATNCRAFAEGVLESELFGHEKGAFTGAAQAREGLFERADGGTLFLDEIGDIAPDFQAKLLRVLQEREVQRVGGAAPRAVDVRLVAATNRDLEAETAAGRFREDLYFRLAVIPLHLAPLRDRPEDILPLARHFLAKAREADAGGPIALTEDAERALAEHDWPGNVRELENAVERGYVLAMDSRITPDDLMLRRSPGPADPVESTSAPVELQAFLERATAHHLRRVLSASGGVKQEAARRLGIDRTTLYRLIKKHGVE